MAFRSTSLYVRAEVNTSSRSANVSIAEDAAFYRQLWARHLDRTAAAFTGAEPGALPGN